MVVDPIHFRIKIQKIWIARKARIIPCALRVTIYLPSALGKRECVGEILFIASVGFIGRQCVAVHTRISILKKNERVDGGDRRACATGGHSASKVILQAELGNVLLVAKARRVNSSY